MRSLVLLVLFVALLLPAELLAQQPTSDIKIRLYLEDGSVLNARLVTPAIAIDTPYGPLSVPCTEIRSILFGTRLGPLDTKDLAAAIRNLGSTVHKEREIAQRKITAMGRRALPALEAAQRSGDAELSTRVSDLLRKIADGDSRPIIPEDTITAHKMDLRGVVRTETLLVQSPILGEKTLQLADIVRITCYSPRSVSIKLDAAKCGGQNETWFDTGICVDAESTLTITASGTIDIWPQAIGQYLTTPKGYNTAGKGGSFMAGALVAKIGDGAPFYVGEKHLGRAGREGTLQLLIVGSPWNNASAGFYDVEVSAK